MAQQPEQRMQHRTTPTKEEDVRGHHDNEEAHDRGEGVDRKQKPREDDPEDEVSKHPPELEAQVECCGRLRRVCLPRVRHE
eukprot:scaffold12822_cov55-Phaeocystis_antarctica.AAC.1